MEREHIGPMLVATLSFALMMYLAFTETVHGEPVVGRMILAILSVGGLVSGLLILARRKLLKYFRKTNPVAKYQ
jgi:hypothetical protein